MRCGAGRVGLVLLPLMRRLPAILGAGNGTLGNWVKAWRDANPESEPELSPVARPRMTELEDEIGRLRMKNEFLKKPRPSSPRRLTS